MKNGSNCVIYFFLILGTCMMQSVIFGQGRDVRDFNQGWKFRLDSVNHYEGTNVNDDDWRTLDLPHDWSIEGAFRKDNPAGAGGGALPGGVGWYRKTFTLPAQSETKSVFIQFDGIYKNSEVWINGNLLGKRPNGYISFQYDLTPYLHFGAGKNILVVKADNSRQPNSRWYSGSGIYRNVWLISLQKLHIAQWGTFISASDVTKDGARVHVTTEMINQSGSEEDIILRTGIYDAAGKHVTSSSETVLLPERRLREAGTVSRKAFFVDQPHLWSEEDPYLYKAVSQVMADGIVIDTYETTFGIRSFRFDTKNGFFLNGRPLKILGVCNHHDLGALGTAVNTRAIERQLQLLKAMGVNGIRTSHNPPAPELLDLCDKMGFIVMDEAFDMWAKPKSEFDYHLDWDQWHKKDLEDQVLRDRNHPSVFFWSIGNEIPEQWGDASKGDSAGSIIARELAGIVRALDTTREIVTANNETNTYNNIIRSGVFDLIGYNYHHDEWATFPEKWPGKKMIVTESTSALETRGYYDLIRVDSTRRWPERWDKPFSNPRGGYTVSAYDNVSTPWGSTHEESVKVLLGNDHVSGMYIWTGFDYLGEPTPYSWPARSSYFGIIDLAGFPKDVYYMYQSMFTQTPVLHVYPHWNWKPGDTVDVIAYYNQADEVELFLNDQSFGTREKSGDELHVRWSVPFSAGNLKAVSRKDGKTVLTRQINTAGAPAKIVLKADRANIVANGKDLSFITATILDDKGIKVPDANNLIRFEVSGTGFLAGVDSGDPVSHESFKGDKHTALNGLALAILQSNGKKGKIRIRAEAAGLEAGAIEIECK